MAVIIRKRPTNVTKEGRKKDAPTPTGGGGSSAPPTSSKFQDLAKSRGVDLAAEQARAKQQLQSGLQVGGTTQSSQQGIAAAQQAAPTAQRSFMDLAGDPFQQGMGRSQAPPPEQDTFFQAKLNQIRAEAAKPVIGFNGKPLDMKELSPFDALALVNIPTGTAARGGVGLFSREAAGITSAQVGTGVARNAVTKGLIKSAAAKVTGKVFWKVVGAIGLGFFIAEKILSTTLGGKNMGQFVGQEEAAQGISMAANAAYYAGNPEAYALAAAARDEVLQNESYWDGMSSLMPFENFATGLNKFKDTAIVQAQVMDTLAADKFAADAAGLDETQAWEQAQARRLENERANIDYYNSERLRMEENLRIANEQQRDEDAAFWAKQQAGLREKEMADQKAIQNFWLQYQKMKQKLSDDNRPSKLNFGII